MSTTTAPFGMPSHVGYHYSSQTLQLGRIFHCSSTLTGLDIQGESFQISSKSISPSSVSEVCGVFYSRVLGSSCRRQPSAMAITYVVLGVFLFSWDLATPRRQTSGLPLKHPGYCLVNLPNLGSISRILK